MACKFYQTRSNTVKHHQTRCPNGKMFGCQAMFDGFWSPNISRLSRALNGHFHVNQTHYPMKGVAQRLVLKHKVTSGLV